MFNSASGLVVTPIRYKDSSYPFISPLVSVSIASSKGFPELQQTQSDVQNVIDTAKAQGVTDVGVYFREPNNAHWFGIGENSKFDPGSLIKVPIMLAYLKEAEENPSILQKNIAYVAEKDPLPNAMAPELSSGEYPADTLLKQMIVGSDNGSKDALINNIDPAAVQDVFDETDTNFLTDPSGTISPKQYIIILSRIYNATYLNRYYSNYAMQLLTQTTFKDGLVAGLPAGVQVAHKYGERGDYEDGALASIELHDCGLVYADKNPYYLCVMTRGTNPSALAQTIATISKTVYDDRAGFSP